MGRKPLCFVVDVTGCDTWDPDNLVNRSMSGDLLPLLTGVHGEAYFGHFASGNDTHVYSLEDINGSLTPVGELSTLNGFLTSPPWPSMLGPSGFIHYDASDTAWSGYTVWVTNFEEDYDDNDGISDEVDEAEGTSRVGFELPRTTTRTSARTRRTLMTCDELITLWTGATWVKLVTSTIH